MTSTPALSLRPAVEADIPFLDTLRRITMRSVIENHYAWDDEAQRSRILAHFEWARIVSTDNRDIGLFKAVYSAADIHLSQIQLLPEYQGRGIASTLIRNLQTDAHASGKLITLVVLRSNQAITLYRRLGFVIYNEAEHFFSMKWSPAA